MFEQHTCKAMANVWPSGAADNRMSMYMNINAALSPLSVVSILEQGPVAAALTCVRHKSVQDPAVHVAAEVINYCQTPQSNSDLINEPRYLVM